MPKLHRGQELRGRLSECKALDRLLKNVRGQQSRVLVLRGEAGVGKTTQRAHRVQGRRPPAAVVVDVSNSPSFGDAAVLEFFETSTANLLAAEAAAGVGHHVALSVVGSDRAPESGYLRAKIAQEKLISSSSIPYSIVRATQFFEFLTRIADEATDGNTVRIAPVLFQPMAAEDVAEAVAIIMQVRGGKPVTLTPGQTFYEGPEDIHVVGRNASSTKPARFLVLLVKNKGTPVLVPAQ
jgi:uncharacterized protein YbjT (DUF2867 family)